jgi:hypothetical protein
MEDDLRALGLKDLPDSPGIAHVADVRADVGPDPTVAEFAVNLEEVVLGPLDHEQPLGAEPHRLPANLRPDASTGARDQHAFPCQKPLEFGRIKINCGSAQEVCQFNRLAQGRPRRPGSREGGVEPLQDAEHRLFYRSFAR